MNIEEAKNKINDLLDQVAEKHKNDPKVFTFKELNLAVLEKGIYNVEKHKTTCTEIRIGYDLHNECIKNIPSFMAGVDAYNGVIFNDLSSRINSVIRFVDIMLGKAKINFVTEKSVYYMGDNEILFLSDHDHIFYRGIKEDEDEKW